MTDPKNSIPNTAKQAQVTPEGMLAEILMFGQGNAIEHQEAQGQKALVNSDVLPTHIGDKNGKEWLEACGIKFLGPVPGDDLFQFVKLPKGWQKRATDHSMWSYLFDDKNRKRARIFYKAAFYDRSATIYLERRFKVDFDYELFDTKHIAVSMVTDADGTVVFSTPEQLKDSTTKKWEASEPANAEAAAWLDANYPNHKDFTAYWD